MGKFVKKWAWAYFASATMLTARADTSVVFNEIMFHPRTNEPGLEWVELYNQMAVDVDVSGWKLASGIDYVFPANSIVRGGGFAVVALSPADLALATGLTNLHGPFTGRLANSGESLQLLNNSGRVVDEIAYGVDGEWPVVQSRLQAMLHRASQ